MRVSVPGLPQAILSAGSHAKPISPSEATLRLVEFLGNGNVTVLTGAGVSVDSGIRAYRGHDGRYMNPNYKWVIYRNNLGSIINLKRPIFYHDLIDKTEKGHYFRSVPIPYINWWGAFNPLYRQRYWLGFSLSSLSIIYWRVSFLKVEIISRLPTCSWCTSKHHSFCLGCHATYLAHSQDNYTGLHVQYISTQSPLPLLQQNVDGLHQKALHQASKDYWDSRRIKNAILELHGTLHVRISSFALIIQTETAHLSYFSTFIVDLDIPSTENYFRAGFPQQILNGKNFLKKRKELPPNPGRIQTEMYAFLAWSSSSRSDLLPYIARLLWNILGSRIVTLSFQTAPHV